MLESATALLTTTNAQHAEATYYLALAQVHAFARTTLELICVDSYRLQSRHSTSAAKAPRNAR